MDQIDGNWLCIRSVANPHLSQVIGSFKSITTNRYSKGVQHQDWSSFDTKLWQRSYFERIIRSDAELSKIRMYVEANAIKWKIDKRSPFPVGTPEFEKWFDALMKIVEDKP